MWREENGFLEMFLAYYGQFEENVSGVKAYRDFLFEVLCAHELSLTSISSAGESTTQTQLEAVANAFQFPWTVPFPLESNHPGSSSEAEAAIQPKTEVLEDECEFVGEMPRPSKVARLTSENKIEASDIMKMQDEATARVYDGSWRPCPSSNSKQSPGLISSQGQGLNSDRDPLIGNEASLVCRSIVASNIGTCEEDAEKFCMSDNFDKFRSSLTQIQEGNTSTFDNEVCTSEVVSAMTASCSRSQDTNLKVTDTYHMKGSSLSTKHQSNNSIGRPFSCQFCPKRFSQSCNLRTHERIHTGSRPYICKVCQKSFSQSSHLRTHERIHTGIRPYVCKICMKSFTRSTHLRKHELIHP